MIGGGAVLCVGLLLLTTMGTSTSPGTATIYMIVCGLGIGPAMPLYTLAIQNDVDVRRLGQATSASQFFRQIGATAGAAAMGAVLALGLAPHLGGGSHAAAASAFATALRPVFQMALTLGLLGAVASLFVPEIPLRRHFEPTAGRGSSLGAAEEEIPEGVADDEASHEAALSRR
jgi:MFS family permease